MDIDKLRRELDAWSTDDIVPSDLAALCAEASAALARLREAGEVMEDIDFIARTTSGPGYEAIHRYTRAFLAKLEAPPAPEPVREDTYPDRVSMEPWPHIGHAPGGKRAGD